MSCSSFIYSFLLFAAIMVSQAAAAGFGVSPSSLEFQVEAGSQSSRQLLLYNTDMETVEFSMATSNPETLQIWPEIVTVAGDSVAGIRVTAIGAKPGEAMEEISISMSGGGREGEVGLALGTMVPAKLRVINGQAITANAVIGTLLSAGIAFFGTAAYLLARAKLGRTTNFI